MTDRRRPIDQLLDLCVFTPIGLAANAREVVPELAAKGRQQVELQVRIARMLGQFAVAQGRRELEKRFSRPAAPQAEAPPPPPAPAEAPADEVIPVRIVEEVPLPADVPRSEDLAIPSYDSLAASQVVSRLAGLAPDELDAVRRYELAHRGRRTVLGRIAQLQGG